jgi:hypothetical protein
VHTTAWGGGGGVVFIIIYLGSFEFSFRHIGNLMGTHWELEGNKGKFGRGYLFILVGLLFKFVVAWFVPNGKGFEQKII